VNPLHGELEKSPTKTNKPFKPGHRKTNSLSMLEGFNSEQEKAGTACLLVRYILTHEKMIFI
jgi:hypothetical protein